MASARTESSIARLLKKILLDKGEKRKKKVLNAMKKAGEPVRPGDIAKAIGEESKEVSKVIAALKKKR